jgi:leader peptidase (prepilin peptidase) / N-methyltransferase
MGLAVWSLGMHLTVGISGFLLALIDQKEHRLPDRGTSSSGVVLGVLALLSDDAARLEAALVGAVLSAGFFALLALFPPHPLGWGDVKLQLVLGFYLAWWCPALVVLQVCGSFVVGGVVAMMMLVTNKLVVSDPIPFGPAMISSAWLSILLWKSLEII